MNTFGAQGWARANSDAQKSFPTRNAEGWALGKHRNPASGLLGEGGGPGRTQFIAKASVGVAAAFGKR